MRYVSLVMARAGVAGTGRIEGGELREQLWGLGGEREGSGDESFVGLGQQERITDLDDVDIMV